MTHEMKLWDAPFCHIRDNFKTIELRLNDEKRQLIKVGDEILFTNNKTGERLSCTVLALHRFESFEALYKSLDLLKCGYTEDDICSASYTDMEVYYSKEKQSKYGVLGIEIAKM